MDYQVNARRLTVGSKAGGASPLHETFLAAQAGKWDVVLRPPSPCRTAGLEICTAKGAGSGQRRRAADAHLAALVRTALLDYSQLESAERLAGGTGVPIEMIRADMSKPLPFEDEAL